MVTITSPCREASTFARSKEREVGPTARAHPAASRHDAGQRQAVRGPGLGVLAFGLAGLGCSALLPLTISFGQEELAEKAAALAGGVIAFYQLGYGIAAFGVGPLLDGGVELHSIYAVAAIIAAAMGAWSFAVARRRPSPSLTPPPSRTPVRARS